MKSLKLFAAILFLGFGISMNAQTMDNNAPIFSNFIELSDGDEVSISSAMISKEKVFIQWKSEIKGVYFEIERSTDGKNYETIATPENVVVASQGTTFQFIDENPEIENYYRVFYITPSGDVNYSEVTFVSPLPSDMTIGGLK